MSPKELCQYIEGRGNGADLAEIFQQSETHDPQLSAAKHTLNASTEGKKRVGVIATSKRNNSFISNSSFSFQCPQKQARMSSKTFTSKI